MLSRWICGLAMCLLSVGVMAIEVDEHALQQAVATDPGDLQARLILGRYYLKEGDFEKAYEQVLSANELQPDDQLASRLIRQLNAIRMFDQTLSVAGISNPYDQAQLEEKVVALHQKNQIKLLDQVLEWLDVEGFRQPTKVRAIYAERLLKTKQAGDALKVIGKVSNTESRPQLERLRAEACYETQQIACALRAYRQVWQQEQLRDDGLRLLELLIERQQHDARALLSEMQQRWPDNEYLIQMSVRLQQQVNRNHVEREHAFQNDPSLNTLRSLVVSLYDDQQQAKALALLDHHLTKFSPDDTTRYFAAERYAWEGQYDKAWKLLSDMEAPTEQSRLLAARISAWNGQLDMAIGQLRELIASAHDQDVLLQSRMMLGFSYHWSGDTATALTYIEPLMKVKSQVLDYPAMNEVVLQGQGDYAKLISLMHMKLTQHPDNSDLILRLANYSERLGDHAQAQESYERYLKLKPDDHPVRQRLGLYYIDTQQQQRGFLHLERFAFQQYSVAALLQLAQQYHWARRSEDALRVLNQLLIQYTGHQPAIALRDQIVKEIPLTKPVVAVDSEQLKQAIAAYRAGTHKVAAALLNEYLQQHPSDMEAHYYYAFSLSNVGNHTAAASEFYIVSRSDRSSDHVMFQYGYNLSRSGNYRAARRVFKQLESKLQTASSNSQPVPEYLLRFIEEWQTQWQQRQFDDYKALYSPKIQTDAGWVEHKSQLFRRNKKIELKLSQPVLLSAKVLSNHEQRSVVQFVQDYHSDLLSDRGNKQLTILCRRSLQCHIEQEVWLPLTSAKDSEKKARQAELLKLLSKELERLELSALERSPGDTVVNTIYFGEGVGKVHQPEEDVLSREYVAAVMLQSDGRFGVLAEDLAAPTDVENSEQENRIAFGYRTFRDSDNADFRMPGVTLRKKWQGYQLNAAAGRFEFAAPGCQRERGYQLDLNLERDGLTVGSHLTQLRNDLKLMPYIRYLSEQDSVFTTVGLDYSALFFDKFSCGSLDHQLTRLRGEFSQYRELGTAQALWYAVSAGHISDDNLELISQFDYVFYKKKREALEYQAAFNGWYLWNTAPTQDYYSPGFYDSNRLRLESSVNVGQSLDLQAVTSLGYTFEESRTLYDYGLWLNYPLADTGAKARLGCRKSNSGRATLANNAYRSTDCSATLEYQW